MSPDEANQVADIFNKQEIELADIPTLERFLHHRCFQMAQCSGGDLLHRRFAPGQPIRGGVPVIFPWFGAREGEPMHGFARLSDWDLHEAVEALRWLTGPVFVVSLPEPPCFGAVRSNILRA